MIILTRGNENQLWGKNTQSKADEVHRQLLVKPQCLVYFSKSLFTRTTSCLESKGQVESVWSALPASSSLQDSPLNHHRCQRRPNLFLDVLSAHSHSSRHLAIDRQQDVHNARVLVPTLPWYNEHRHGRDSRSTIESHPMKTQFHRTEHDRESVVMFLNTIDRCLSTLWLHAYLEWRRDCSNRSRNLEDEQYPYRQSFLQTKRIRPLRDAEVQLTRLNVALCSFIRIGDEESRIVSFFHNDEGNLRQWIVQIQY